MQIKDEEQTKEGKKTQFVHNNFILLSRASDNKRPMLTSFIVIYFIFILFFFFVHLRLVSFWARFVGSPNAFALITPVVMSDAVIKQNVINWICVWLRFRFVIFSTPYLGSVNGEQQKCSLSLSADSIFGPLFPLRFASDNTFLPFNF